MKLKSKIVRWALGGIIALVVLLVALHFALFYAANSPWVKRKIGALALSAFTGPLEYSQLRIGLLPLPYLSMFNGRIAIQNRVTIEVGAITLRPAILPLFFGRPRLGALTAQAPAISIYLPEKSAAQTHAGGNEAALLGVLISYFSANFTAVMENASVAIFRGQACITQFNSLKVQTIAKERALHLDLKGRGLLADTLELGLDIDGAALASSDANRANSPALRLVLHTTQSNIVELKKAAFDLAGKKSFKALEAIQGGRLISMALSSSGSSLKQLADLNNLSISAQIADGRFLVPGVDLDVTAIDGDWQLTQGVLSAQHVSARLGATQGRAGMFSLDLTQRPLPMALDIELVADLSDLPPILRKVISNPATLAELDGIHDVQGKAKGKLTLSGAVGALDAQVALRDVVLSATSHRLPFPITLQSGQVSYKQHGLFFDHINGRIHDTEVNALSGFIAWQGTLRAQLNLTGRIGEQTAQWAYQRFRVPPELCIRAPIAMQQLALRWQQPEGVWIETTLGLADTIKVTAQAHASADRFDLQHLTIADEFSAARINVCHDSLRRNWDVGYSGHLEGKTVAAIWPNGLIRAARLDGDFSARLSAEDAQPIVLNGQVTAVDVALPRTPLGAIDIHHARMESHQEKLDVHALEITVDEQRLALNGEVVFSAATIGLELLLAAQTLDLEQLEKKIRSIRDHQNPGTPNPETNFHISGHITLQAAQLNYAHLAWKPVQAILVLGKEQTTLNVQEANLCGISTLGTMAWTPRGMHVTLIPKASDQALAFTGGCLAGASTTERIEGTYNVSGQLTTTGTDALSMRSHLLGKVHLNANDGRVYNVGEVGILTNILSFISIGGLIKGDAPDLKKRDFNFSRIELLMRFADDHMELEEVHLYSDALNMVGEGRMDLATQQMDLTLLVSPLTTMDAIIKHIPVVGRILNGTLLTIPIRVQGPVSNPQVTAFSPKAVGAHLLGILERTIKTPYFLIEPILPTPAETTDGQNLEKTDN